jgi:predicted amidophosphoribosyltransferase
VTFEGIGPIQSLITSLKNGSAPHLSSLLAAYMAVQYSQSTFPLPDVITAVPSSRWRQWQMGQESAVTLAKDFAKLLERPFLPLLKRKRQLMRQEFLAREERSLLSPEDFQWKMKENLHGKTILLIDDTIKDF